MGDTYPGNTAAETARKEHEEPHHKIQIVHHMEVKEDNDKSDLI